MLEEIPQPRYTMAQSTATGPSLHQLPKAPIQAPTLVTVTHQRPITSPGGTPSSALTPVDISLPLVNSMSGVSHSADKS